jgi:hypothetical protein
MIGMRMHRQTRITEWGVSSIKNIKGESDDYHID